MKPVDRQKKEKLEQILGYTICSLTVEQYKFGIEEWSAFGTGITIYRCCVDGGPARGGKKFKQNSFEGILTPCSRAYGVMCVYYRTN